MIRDHFVWKIRPYYRRVAGLLLLGLAAGIIANTSVVLPAILMGRAIDIVLLLDSGQAAMNDVLIAALLYVGGNALYFSARMGKRWWLRTANQRTAANMRGNALRGVLAWPMASLHNESVGDIMTRIIGDVQVFITGFNEVTTELADTWLFSFSLFAAMLAYDVGLAFMALALVPLALILAYYSARWVRSRTLAMRQANSDLAAALQEYLSGIRILRLFGRTDVAVGRVDLIAERLRRANLAETRLRVGLQPVYSIMVTAGVLLVVWLGGRRVVEGTMTTGALVAFLQLYLRFVGRGHRIPMFFNRIQSAGVAYQRLERMLAPSPPVEAEPPRASFKPNYVNGLCQEAPATPTVGVGPLAARLRDVSLRYPGTERLALQHVSLHIPAGSLVAVTGPVGSGKSALLRALVGLYPPAEGEVLVDGRPVGEWPADVRAMRVAYVPQEPGLFSGTVRENITMTSARVGSLLHMDDIIARAGLQQDVAGFPQGLDTPIGEGGIQVSGGQRQRLALARALAAGGTQHPGLILLDDPFASVDVEVEGQIIAALRQAFGPAAEPSERATLVLCSHRLAAFPDADRIVVLDHGRVMEQGTHAELINAAGLYARIYRAQYQVEGETAEEQAR